MRFDLQLKLCRSIIRWADNRTGNWFFWC